MTTPERDVAAIRAEDIARAFHEAYERLAPSFGYETRKASAVPWSDVPAANKALMVAVAGEVRSLLLSSPDPVAGDGLRERITDEVGHAALMMLSPGAVDSTGHNRQANGEPHGDCYKCRRVRDYIRDWLDLYGAGLRSSPVEPPLGLAGPIGVEERVELARAMGRMQAELIGRIVMAAGGEVRVPDNLLVRDVTVDSDFVNGTTIYRARLLPTQASDSKEKTT